MCENSTVYSVPRLGTCAFGAENTVMYDLHRGLRRTVKVVLTACATQQARPPPALYYPLARVIGDQGGSVATSALSASSFSAHRAAAWCPSYTTLVRDRLGLGLGLGFRFRLGLG